MKFHFCQNDCSEFHLGPFHASSYKGLVTHRTESNYGNYITKDDFYLIQFDVFHKTFSTESSETCSAATFS